jgi:hypothetical protein
MLTISWLESEELPVAVYLSRVERELARQRQYFPMVENGTWDDDCDSRDARLWSLMATDLLKAGP